MSASDENSAIFMTDTAKQIQKKINKFAFSCGQATLEEHRQKGGNVDVDIAYQYMRFFKDDDAFLEQIEEAYKKGELLSSEMKKHCIDALQAFVKEFQDRRAEVSPEVVKSFMTPHKLVYGQKERKVPAKERPSKKK